jgi:branched-chain amino acid aminotransferase
LTRYDLYNADEVFLTGTAVEIVPVVNVDGRIIGDGKPGKITRELRRIFYDYVRQKNVGSPVYADE